MAIDMNREQLLTYPDAAEALLKIRPGRKLGTLTFWRWANKGLRGVKLEVVQFGGRPCTSIEALLRFFQRLPARASREPRVKLRTRRVEKRAANEAAAYLDAKGIGTPPSAATEKADDTRAAANSRKAAR